MASRKESTTRAQSFFEIIGPAVRAICVVTCSTRSALVIGRPQRKTLRRNRTVVPRGPPRPRARGSKLWRYLLRVKSLAR